jgi:hypothetical protein
VPQLRQSDTRKIDAMQGEITNLKQAMSTMSAPGKRRETGTVPKQDSDVLAPHIRFVWVPVEAEMAEEQLFSKGERALNRGDFTEIEKKENLIYGYDREYIGLIAAIQPTLIMFMIAGPDWQAADRKLEKLKRGF